MNTTTSLRHLLWGALVLGASHAQGQATLLGHTGGPGDHLGWNAGTLQALEVRHDGSWPIDFYTTNRFRMRINPTVTYPTLNNFINIPADGFALITPDNSFLMQPPKGPFSRLHLAEGGHDNAQTFGYRLWQRNGITFTGNADQGYIGHKYGEPDETDMVIQWSDNPGFQRADRMRFIFTSEYQIGVPTGMNSLEGLEGMRLWPKDGSEILVGVGDFFAGGDDPTERLDIRTGRLRIRDLPPSLPDNTLNKVMVVDNTGVVKWRDGNTFGGCDWLLDPNTLNVLTAYGSGTCPPDIFRGVGIGLDPAFGQQPKAKLEVFLPDLFGNPNPASTLDGYTGIRSSVLKSTTAASGMAMDAYALTTSTLAGTGSMTGIRAKASNGNYSYGVDASAQIPSNVSGTATDVIGVRGIGTTYNNATRTIGVYGNTTGTPSGSTWAFWSDGFTFSMGGANWIPSDENLKQNIEDVTDASSMLAQLVPKSYEYNGDEYPFLAFNQGRHFGIMAQNLSELLPEAVREITRPADVDSAGNVVVPAATFKVVNYEALLPLLIASNNEQKVRLDQLEQELATCCVSGGSRSMQSSGKANSTNGGKFGSLQEVRLLINPNPFTDHTTLSYFIDAPGKVSLQVSDNAGRPISTLREEHAMAGAFTYEWDTQHLAAGTYFVALVVDGNVVVKRAVKVGER